MNIRKVIKSHDLRHSVLPQLGRLGIYLGRDWTKPTMRPFSNADVAAVFDAYPRNHRGNLMALRELIFDVADSIEGVGPLEETLKWGEPAYLTAQSKTGSTIRIDWKQSNPAYYAMYFHCQTDLVKRFRKLFPNDFEFDGNRSIMFSTDDPMPVDQLSACIAAALTYHRDKKCSKS